MGQVLFVLGVSSLVFGGDVGDGLCQLDEAGPPGGVGLVNK